MKPTCTAVGYSGDYQCTGDCGQIFRYGHVIDKLSHDWDGGKPATQGKSEGLLYTCRRVGCGETRFVRNPVATEYTVTVIKGTASVAAGTPITRAMEGVEVTVTAQAPAGKHFVKWVVKAGGVTLANETSATTTFIMPANDVTIEAEFAENPFVDVSESSVYYDAILWAYYHEPQQITGGYTATEFRPGNPCTRGQVVTFLWRAAGCPEPTGDTSMFKDASSIAAPYQKAVAWAVEKGITTGFADGTFRPNDSVTRAQFVTFLWRYENRPATSGSIAGFTDASSIAEPYQQAVAWAVEKGITTGYNDGSFRPNATCTRWAVVLFMYRDMT